MSACGRHLPLAIRFVNTLGHMSGTAAAAPTWTLHFLLLVADAVSGSASGAASSSCCACCSTCAAAVVMLAAPLRMPSSSRHVHAHINGVCAVSCMRGYKLNASLNWLQQQQNKHASFRAHTMPRQIYWQSQTLSIPLCRMWGVYAVCARLVLWSRLDLGTCTGQLSPLKDIESISLYLLYITQSVTLDYKSAHWESLYLQFVAGLWTSI